MQAQLYINKARLFPQYGRINYVDNGAGHQYNGLTLAAKRDLAKGLAYQFSWEWARDTAIYRQAAGRHARRCTSHRKAWTRRGRRSRRGRIRYQWWRGFWDHSGGNMTDQGTHLMDVVQWMSNSGPPLSAVCQGRIINAPGDDVPNVFTAVFEYPEFIATWTLDYRSGGRSAPGQPGVPRGKENPAGFGRSTDTELMAEDRRPGLRHLTQRPIDPWPFDIWRQA